METDSVPSELIRAQKVPNMLITCWTARSLLSLPVAPSPNPPQIAGEYREKPLPPRKSCDLSLTPDSPQQPRVFSRQKLKTQAWEVASRLNLYRNQVLGKLEKQRIAKEREETRDCSFAPKLTSKQYQTPNRVPLSHNFQALMPQSPPNPPLAVSPPSFHPTLDHHSLELTHSRNPANVFTALYTTTCATLEPQESPSFRPSINPQSSTLVRTLPVAELLYQDACRRRGKVGGKVGSGKKAEISQASEEIVRKRFRREFLAGFKELFEGKRDSLTMAEMSRLMVRLRFIEEKSKEGKRLFAFLTTSQLVDVDSLYVCLCGILGLAQASPHSAGDVRSLFRQLYVNRLRLPASTKAIPKEETALTGLRTEDYIYRRKMPFRSPLKSPPCHDAKAAFSRTTLL